MIDTNRDHDVIDTPSPNRDARPPGVMVDHLVLHYTGMKTAAAALARLCDPAAGVSAHYLLDEDGEVYTLVPEAGRAWHAGVSYWRGVRQLNDRSIGIEIVNPGHEWGYRPFPLAQMTSLVRLCHGILRRHAIPARNVVGHSDIAPDRKQDPGELFDWRWLAGQGIGVWTEDLAQSASFEADLEAIGYDPAMPQATVITAFQRHFMPMTVTGRADAATAARAAAITTLVDAAG